MKKNVHRVVFILAVLLCRVFVFSQSSEVENLADTDKKETIVFHADKMSGSTARDAERVELAGSAYIKTSSMEIYADSIELAGSNYRAVSASGNIRGKNLDSGFDFTCDRLSYDRQTKVAFLQGTVTMDDPENEVKVSAQAMEYNQDTETALLQIGVRLEKKENICTAAFAVYRKKEKLLEMTGRPQVTRGEDTFRALEIIFNIDSEEITLDGKVSGSVTDAGEEKKP